MNGNKYTVLEQGHWNAALEMCSSYSWILQETGVLSIFENSIHLTEQCFENARKYSNISEKDVHEEDPWKFSNIANNYTHSFKRYFQVGKIEVFCLSNRKEDHGK